MVYLELLYLFFFTVRSFKFIVSVLLSVLTLDYFFLGGL